MPFRNEEIIEMANRGMNHDQIAAAEKEFDQNFPDKNAIGAPIPEPKAAPYDLATDEKQGPLVRGLATGIKTAFPIDAMQEMSGQMMHTRPIDVGNMVGALGSVASALPALATPGGGAALGAAGATAGGLEAMGVKNPYARFGLPALAALMAGRFQGGPKEVLNAVPKGEEINALGHQASGMGIPIGEIPAQSMTRTGPNPADIRSAWNGAIEPLGAKVGTTKAAAMQTTASTPQVLKSIQQAGQSGLEEAGVPRVGLNLRPDLSREEGAAKLVLDHLQKIGAIPRNTPPEKAMEFANNVLEAAKKITSESSSYGPNLAGRTAGMGLDRMQAAIDSLGSPAAVAEHQAANQVFSKGKALQDMVEAASKGKGAGPVPMFRPKDFIANWQGMEQGAKEAAFSPEEIAQIDSLTQQNPNALMRGLQYVNEKARDLGVKKLAFHPSTRFYEQGTSEVPRLGTSILASGAGGRSANYDPQQDPQAQWLASKLGGSPSNSLRQALQR